MAQVSSFDLTHGARTRQVLPPLLLHLFPTYARNLSSQRHPARALLLPSYKSQNRRSLWPTRPMESSVGSNSPPPSPPRRRRSATRYYNPAQQLSDRIARALHHRLRLLHRSGADFFVLGATGNVYNVTLSGTPACTCPDRAATCKHTLFVLLRVLGLPLDDACIRRGTLRPLQLRRLLLTPTSPEALAGSRTRERFQQLFLSESGGAREGDRRQAEGTCPVCLEEMSCDGDGGLATCSTCGNSVHEECFLRWRRSRGRRAASCVMCRAKWRDRKEQERYLNLGAYNSEDETAAEGSGSCAG